MRAILACLLMVTGAVLGAEQLVTSEPAFWAGAILVAQGAALLLLRPRRAGRPHDDNCRTCRGAGTVYSAEYNDWRRSGPIQTIRELCPSCEGLQRVVS